MIRVADGNTCTPEGQDQSIKIKRDVPNFRKKTPDSSRLRFRRHGWVFQLAASTTDLAYGRLWATDGTDSDTSSIVVSVLRQEAVAWFKEKNALQAPMRAVIGCTAATLIRRRRRPTGVLSERSSSRQIIRSRKRLCSLGWMDPWGRIPLPYIDGERPRLCDGGNILLPSRGSRTARIDRGPTALKVSRTHGLSSEHAFVVVFFMGRDFANTRSFKASRKQTRAVIIKFSTVCGKASGRPHLAAVRWNR